MPTAKPYLAFMAAALVLLVMPLLVMAGLMAIGLATGAGMMSQMNRMMDSEASGAALAFFVHGLSEPGGRANGQTGRIRTQYDARAGHRTGIAFAAFETAAAAILMGPRRRSCHSE